MHAARLGTLLLLVVPATANAQASRGPLDPDAFAITNVSVIPMDSERIIEDATVVVKGGRIADVGRDARVPDGVRAIDGRGKYLIPGLTDMHAHLLSDDWIADSLAPWELGVMVANGVTATRFMMGTPEQLALREQVKKGEVLGPQLWLASPEFAGRKYGQGFRGYAVATPDEARAAVNDAADKGYDFIKITMFVQPGPYEALVDQARKRNIRVVGHVSPEVGVPRALAAGQQIEHLDNYLEHVLADSAPMKGSVSDRGVYNKEMWTSLDYVDERKIQEMAGRTARAGVWTDPTLTVFKKAFGLGQAEAEFMARPDWNLIPDDYRDLYQKVSTRYWTNPATEPRRLRWVEVRDRLVKAIVDSGGKVMTGSDAPEFFFTYGFTVHRELESLVAAGLTPWQALQASTTNPAEYLRASKEWGTIEKGKRADLVLLDANPLTDIRNTTKIDAVVVGGRWLDRPTRERMVLEASRKIRSQ